MSSAKLDLDSIKGLANVTDLDTIPQSARSSCADHDGILTTIAPPPQQPIIIVGNTCGTKDTSDKKPQEGRKQDPSLEEQLENNKRFGRSLVNEDVEAGDQEIPATWISLLLYVYSYIAMVNTYTDLQGGSLVNEDDEETGDQEISTLNIEEDVEAWDQEISTLNIEEDVEAWDQEIPATWVSLLLYIYSYIAMVNTYSERQGGSLINKDDEEAGDQEISTLNIEEDVEVGD